MDVDNFVPSGKREGKSRVDRGSIFNGPLSPEDKDNSSASHIGVVRVPQINNNIIRWVHIYHSKFPIMSSKKKKRAISHWHRKYILCNGYIIFICIFLEFIKIL